jgi:hypothetical protein
MTLHARVSRLDDYAGELVQTLEKLQSERAQGALNRMEQEDFLADLRKAIEIHDLRPLRLRVRLDLALAALTAMVATFLALEDKVALAPLAALLALSLLGLGLALWRYTLYLRRRHDQRWLGYLETAVAKGGTIFDEIDRTTRMAS